MNELFFAECSSSSNPLLNFLNKEWGFTHTLNFSVLHNDFVEMFWFSSTEGNRFINFCVNNFQFLKSFMNFIKVDAADEIQRFEQDRIWRNITDSDRSNAKSFIESERHSKTKIPSGDLSIAENLFYDETNCRFYLPNRDALYLTKRELECLIWLAQGKSAEESSLILLISRRTVETHIRNLKEKMGCYKQTDLVRKAFHLGILNCN